MDKITNHRHPLSHAIAGWDKEGTPYLEGLVRASGIEFEIVGNGSLPAPLDVVRRQDATMADRWVRYYREWADLSPQAHEETGNTFTDFTEYARTKAGIDGVELAYLQWWNCKPFTEQQGAPIPNTRSNFAVIEFDDGSYAVSPGHDVEQRRKWLVGRPS